MLLLARDYPDLAQNKPQDPIKHFPSSFRKLSLSCSGFQPFSTSWRHTTFQVQSGLLPQQPKQSVSKSLSIPDTSAIRNQPGMDPVFHFLTLFRTQILSGITPKLSSNSLLLIWFGFPLFYPQGALGLFFRGVWTHHSCT